MALYTHLSRKQITSLVAQFGLPAPKSIKGIAEGTVNTYYRLTYPGAVYFLKIDEVGDKKRLINELKVFGILENLTGLGFITPKLVPTESNKAFIPFGKKFILLFQKVDGKSLYGKNLKPAHLKQLGAALARLHQKTQNVPLPPHRFHLPELKRVFIQIQKKLITKHPAVDVLIQKLFDEVCKKNITALPQGLIHADLFPENTLFTGNKLSGIIDFEAAGLGPFLFDVAVLIHAGAHEKKGYNKPKAKAILQGYTSVRRFTVPEKKAFTLILRLAALRFLLTRLRDFELKDGPVKAKPFKDFREYVKIMDEIEDLQLL